MYKPIAIISHLIEQNGEIDLSNYMSPPIDQNSTNL